MQVGDFQSTHGRGKIRKQMNHSVAVASVLIQLHRGVSHRQSNSIVTGLDLLLVIRLCEKAIDWVTLAHQQTLEPAVLANQKTDALQIGGK